MYLILILLKFALILADFFLTVFIQKLRRYHWTVGFSFAAAGYGILIYRKAESLMMIWATVNTCEHYHHRFCSLS